MRTSVWRTLTLLTMLSIAMVLTSPPPALAQSGTFEKVTKAKQLSVGYAVYPPAVMKDPATGKLSGHYIDAIEFIAGQWGVKINYVEVTWATFVAALQSGKIDLSVATTFRTIPRAVAVDFTKPVFWAGFDVLVKKSEQRFRTLNDLNQPGVKVAVSQGGANHEYAKKYLTKATSVAVPTTDNTQIFMEVLSGRADAAIGGSVDVGLFVKKQAGELRSMFPEKPFNVVGFGWAVRKGDHDLLNFLNVGIDYVLSTGLEKEWEAKYGVNHPSPKMAWE